jgi:hypothetical protein
MVKNHQHQHKGKPHIHEKIQGAAISRAVAMIIFRGVNLSGAHCNSIKDNSCYKSYYLQGNLIFRAGYENSQLGDLISKAGYENNLLGDLIFRA